MKCLIQNEFVNANTQKAVREQEAESHFQVLWNSPALLPVYNVLPPFPAKNFYVSDSQQLRHSSPASVQVSRRVLHRMFPCQDLKFNLQTHAGFSLKFFTFYPYKLKQCFQELKLLSALFYNLQNPTLNLFINGNRWNCHICVCVCKDP